MSLLGSRYSVVLLILNVVLAYYLLGYLRAPNAALKKSSAKTPKVAVSSLLYREYTLEELLPFNGQDKQNILIAVDQRIFDVSSSPHHYGPGGSYHALAGRDASRPLATNIIPKSKPGQLQEWDNLSDLTVEERKTLNEWVGFFDQKYPRVGTLVPLHAWAGSDQEDGKTGELRGSLVTNLQI